MNQTVPANSIMNSGTFKFRYSELAGNRIFGLDMVRALSVCAVVFAHTGYERIFGFRYGVIAIEYFFVMSGFLVGEMLVKEFLNGADRKTLLNFWIKRWFRTLPLYYLILGLKIIFSESQSEYPYWPYFLFLQNNIGGIGFFVVSWTLVIEEWFYLFMPLLIFLVFRKGITKSKFLALSLVVIAGENILRLLYVYYRDVPWGGVVGSFPFRFDSFMLGVLIAYVKIEYRNYFEVLARSRSFATNIILFSIYLILYAYSDGGEITSKVIWTSTVGFTLTSTFMALQMPFLNNSVFLNKIGDKNVIKRLLTWLSLLSYPIYLIHLEFLHLFVTENSILNLTMNYAVIVGFSYLLIVFFHQPVTALRKRFLIR